MMARIMMLNCVQETSVTPAVVLSVGLLRLVSRAWVAAAVLELLGRVTPGKPLPVVVEVVPKVVVAGADVGDVRASVMVVFAGIGIAFGAKRRNKRIFANLFFLISQS